MLASPRRNERTELLSPSMIVRSGPLAAKRDVLVVKDNAVLNNRTCAQLDHITWIRRVDRTLDSRVVSALGDVGYVAGYDRFDQCPEQQPENRSRTAPLHPHPRNQSGLG